PNVSPNKKLRAKMNKESATKLFSRLQKLDRGRAVHIDRKNPRRLIRAIEIALANKDPEKNPEIRFPKLNSLKIGIFLEKENLVERIEKRLHSRIGQGMIIEARRLHKKGLSWKRMDELGLEYRYLA